MINTTGGTRRSPKKYLRCKRYSIDSSMCTTHTICLAFLEHEVTRYMAQHIKDYYDMSRARDVLATAQTQTDGEAIKLSNEIDLTELRLAQNGEALRLLYQDRVDEVVDTVTFMKLKDVLGKEADQIRTELNLLCDRQKRVKSDPAEIDKLVNKWLGVDVLSAELVGDLIDRIEIGARQQYQFQQKIHIHWNF